MVTDLGVRHLWNITVVHRWGGGKEGAEDKVGMRLEVRGSHLIQHRALQLIQWLRVIVGN
jgi:hypothetical protein